MKLLNTKEKIKKKQFEDVYKSYVGDIYKVCFYFLKDEKKARKITEQVFVEFYTELDRVNSDHTFSYLVHKAKRLSTNEQVHESAKGEVRENE